LSRQLLADCALYPRFTAVHGPVHPACISSSHGISTRDSANRSNDSSRGDSSWTSAIASPHRSNRLAARVRVPRLERDFFLKSPTSRWHEISKAPIAKLCNRQGHYRPHHPSGRKPRYGEALSAERSNRVGCRRLAPRPCHFPPCGEPCIDSYREPHHAAA
jgi:hypothetical protein